MTDELYTHDPKDVELENEISAHLRNSGMGEFHVSVRGGHATISGTADDFSTKRQITSEVRSIGGVHEVTNNVRVTGDYYEDKSDQNI